MPQTWKKYWKNLNSGKQKLAKGLLGVTIGAVAGFAYYTFVGCSSGHCPITSDPYISTAWGGVIGGFWALG